MAEYLPLLERAIAGLQDATPDARRAIYDRARNALLGQLRTMDPPVPEADIQRESLALDEAIARLEAKVGGDRPAATPSRPTAASPPIGPTAPAATLPASAPAGPGSGSAPSLGPPPGRERPVVPPRIPPAAPKPRPSPTPRPTGPNAALRPPAPALRPPPPQPRVGGTSPRVGIAVRPIGRPVVPAAEPDATSPGGVAQGREATPAEGTGGAEASAQGLPAATMPATLVAQPGPDTPIRSEDGFALSRVRPADEGGIGPGPGRTRDDPRPLAPRAPAGAPSRGLRSYVLAGVVLLLVIGIAVLAWRLRDRPEAIVAAQAPAASSETAGKIVSRADNEGDSHASPAAEPAGDAAVVPTPVPQGDQQPASVAPVSPPAPAETASPNADIPVSQRAALLVDAPDEPQKVKTYVGSVVWRSESVSPGQDQPLSTAVRADIDIPDAKLTVSMVIKKNLEAQFPASHTLEFHFAEQPGNMLGPVKQINVPDLRQDDAAPTGDPLIGVPVSITDDYFLVGLSRGGAEGQNLQLLAGRNWIDVSILLNSGKVGKLTFEKGPSGQRVLEDALRSWR